MKDNRKVKCPKCGVELGHQGLSRHMWFRHGGKSMQHFPKKIVPGEHPVEDLERTISKLVQRETALRDQIEQMGEIQLELASVGQLRESLEKVVETYRQRKEVLTGMSA